MLPGGGAVQAVRGAGASASRGPGRGWEVEASRAFGQVQVLELYGLAATGACASAICEARVEGLVFVVVVVVVVGGGGDGCVGGGGGVGFGGGGGDDGGGGVCFVVGGGVGVGVGVGGGVGFVVFGGGGGGMDFGL